MSLKVLHVIPAVAPRYGGPSRAVLEMCRGLAETGLYPTLAATDADGKGRLDVPLQRLIDYQGLPSIFFRRDFSEGFKYSSSLARWLEGAVAGFDVVHIHAVFSHSSLAAARSCRRRGVPYVVRPLGSLDPWSLRYKRCRKRLLWHLGVLQMLKGAAALHYTSRAEQRQSEETLASGKGVVIPLGTSPPVPECSVSPPRRFWPELGESPYVLVLSRIDPIKGLEPLLEAFLDLGTEFRQWKLVVAGDGEREYVDGLKQWVRELGESDRIWFTGWLEEERKRAALKGAALLALTSLHENFGIVVLEGLAAGVPVLITPQVALAQEVAEFGAGWVVPLQAAEIQRGLAQALRNEPERIRRGRLGQKLVRERFQWKEISSRLGRLYGEICLWQGDGAKKAWLWETKGGQECRLQP